MLDLTPTSQALVVLPPAPAEPIQPGFDYSLLPAKDARAARACAVWVRGMDVKTVALIIEIGDRLLKIKPKVGHGNFRKWLQAEFGGRARTALNYMHAAEWFADKCETISHLAPTTLYSISAPSTPNPTRQAIMRRLELERVGDAEIKALIKASKAKKTSAAASETEVTSPWDAQRSASDVWFEDEAEAALHAWADGKGFDRPTAIAVLAQAQLAALNDADWSAAEAAAPPEPPRPKRGRPPKAESAARIAAPQVV